MPETYANVPLTMAMVCYSVATAHDRVTGQDVSDLYVTNTRTRNSLPDGACAPLEAVPWNYLYTGFRPRETAWVATWDVFVPGTGETLHQTGETLFAANVLPAK
jgi:hypothetical protein